jgi:hypothetical protein
MQPIGWNLRDAQGREADVCLLPIPHKILFIFENHPPWLRREETPCRSRSTDTVVRDGRVFRHPIDRGPQLQPVYARGMVCTQSDQHKAFISRRKGVVLVAWGILQFKGMRTLAYESYINKIFYRQIPGIAKSDWFC